MSTTGEGADREEAIRALPLLDQVLHAIGETAQAEASLESAILQLHRVLLGSGLSRALAGSRRGVTPLADDCRAMLAKAEMLPIEMRTDGEQALVEAKEVAKLRHRVVHDRWMAYATSHDSPLLLYRMSLDKEHPMLTSNTVEDLDYIKNAVGKLRRSQWRVHALGGLVAASPHGPFGVWQEGSVWQRDMLEILRGDFNLEGRAARPFSSREKSD